MIQKSAPGSKRLVIAIYLLLAVAVNAIGVRAQEPAPQEPQPPKSPEVLRSEEEIARAQRRQAIAEAEKAEAEARKAELEARFPKPTSQPLAGTTTVNDAAIIESMMIAYVSMAKAANRLAHAIKMRSLKMPSLAVYNERDINLLLSYKVVKTQVRIIKDGYCSLLTPEAAGNDSRGNPLCPPSDPTAPPTLTPLMSIASSFLGGFVDLTAFLRTNVEIKGHTFDIDEAPLVSEVFRAMRKDDELKDVRLYYPFVFPPDFSPNEESEILTLLQDLRDLRVRAENLIGNIVKKGQEIEETKASIKKTESSIEALKGKEKETVAAAIALIDAHCGNLPVNEANILDVIEGIKDAKKKPCRGMPAEARERLFALRDLIKDTRSKLSAAEKRLVEEQGKQKTLEAEFNSLKEMFKPAIQNKNDLDNAIARLKSLNEQFDKLVSSLVQADSATGLNPLTSYIRAENLMESVPKGSYWLQLKVLKAGGNNRIKTNLIIDIFTGGNRLSHSGGAIVAYNLFDSNGESVLSDTITEYTNYIKAGKIKGIPELEVDDCVKKNGVINCVTWPARTP